jgi:hypothetical protein
VFALWLVPAEELEREQMEIGVGKGLVMELDAVEVSIVRCCKMDLEIHFSPKIGLSGLLKTLKFPCLLKEVSIGVWSLPGRSQGNFWIIEHRIFVFAVNAVFEEIQEYRVDSVKRELLKQMAKAEYIP